jgi:replicative DNA helicase
MNENTENTLTAYLGPDFQLRLMWQLLVEPEFAEKIIPDLAVEYFDNPNLKRLFIIIIEYYGEYEKVPNLQNKSIHQAINEYKTPNSQIEEESLFSVIKNIELWNQRIINKQMYYDGDAIQKSTKWFIKQQEYRKLAERIIDNVKTGEIRNKYTVNAIEDKFMKITHIGEDEDDCESVTEGIEKALRKEFRETIATGIGAIDDLTGGGLGKGEIGVILAPSGVGKALPNSHKVLTPTGWVENGTLKTGDLVVGSDGKPQKILGVYPQGVRKIYLMEFSDNTKSYCDVEHLWNVNSLKQRTSKTRINGKSVYFPDNSFQTLKTSEIMEDYRTEKGLNYRLPNVAPVEFPETNLSLHPYVLGAMLGDGCLTKKNQPHLITSDKFIVDRFRVLNENVSVSKYSGRYENYKDLYRVSIPNSRKLFEGDLNLYGTNSSTKFIPHQYLINSVKNRVLLLQGLIDTDGTLNKNGTIIYTTISKQLSVDVRELVLSLGGSCRTNEKQKYYRNEKGEKINCKLSYNLTISFPDNGVVPCSLPSKLERFKPRNKYEFNKFIKNVEYSHDEEATCIYVENHDNLYVIDDYVLTHNTTALTVIANTAYECDKNVAHIVFEDTKDQIKRKHYVIWADSALSKLSDDEEHDRVLEVARAKGREMEGRGRLMVKRFSQEDTTMKDIRNWMTNYEKKFGFKWDMLVLDYLDCVESHKKTPDRNEAELTVIKGFESLASDFDIPAWTAIQSNRSGIGSEFVEAQQTGGSIKRMQKAHFFMSIGKTQSQQEANFANIRIIKARFAKDGQMFEDCIFNNDTMKIIIDDPRYRNTRNYKNLKHYTDEEVDTFNKKASSQNRLHAEISAKQDELKAIGGRGMNDLLYQNAIPEESNEPPRNNDDAVNDTLNDAVTEEILELDGDITVSDKPPETPVTIGDVKLLDWSGKTETIGENLEEVGHDEHDKTEDKQTKPPEVTVQEPLEPINESRHENLNADEIEKKMMTDPDEPEGHQKTLYEILQKKGSNQQVIQKE